MLRLLHHANIKVLPAWLPILSVCQGKFAKLVLLLRPYRRGLLLLLWPISTLITELAAANPYLTEYIYSRGIYPVLAGIFGRLFGIFPFSVAKILFYVKAYIIPALCISNFHFTKSIQDFYRNILLDFTWHLYT